MIILTYVSFSGSPFFESTAQIRLSCTSWKNPTTKDIVTGYKIRTLDSDGLLLVQKNFAIDSTSFLPSQFDKSSVSLSLTDKFAGENTDHTI